MEKVGETWHNILETLWLHSFFFWRNDAAKNYENLLLLIFQHLRAQHWVRLEGQRERQAQESLQHLPGGKKKQLIKSKN